MTVNLYLALALPFQPKRWKSVKEEQKTPLTEHADAPVPGTYTFYPGRGWHLVAIDTPTGSEAITPQKVIYSQILLRWLLAAEYQDRIIYGRFLDSSSKDPVGFFRLDDGFTWVHAYDEEGMFISHRRYERLVIDRMSGKFRPAMKSDDPQWLETHDHKVAQGVVCHSSAASMISSIHVKSGINSCSASIRSVRSSMENQEEREPSRPATPARHGALLSVEDARLPRRTTSPLPPPSPRPKSPVRGNTFPG